MCWSDDNDAVWQNQGSLNDHLGSQDHLGNDLSATARAVLCEFDKFQTSLQGREPPPRWSLGSRTPQRPCYSSWRWSATSGPQIYTSVVPQMSAQRPGDAINGAAWVPRDRLAAVPEGATGLLPEVRGRGGGGATQSQPPGE